MPYRMHAEYLRRIYLDNEFAAGRLMVDARPAALQNIRVPIFAVGTERDHVAPWRSVYKIHAQADADQVTFVLTSGGHNAGIVSEPGHAHRHFRIATRQAGDVWIDADEWMELHAPQEGSWWPAWAGWLEAQTRGEGVGPPPMGAPEAGYPAREDAPGTYVLQG